MKRRILIVAFFGAACVFFVSARYVHAATLRLSPASGSFILGSTFDVSVIMNTEGEAANTVEVELLFPPNKLQLANPSLGKSIVEIWASPPTFSNQEGRIYFVGGIPSPGINTSQGIVQSFTFRVIAPGAAKISFGENTSVLANDGLGSSLLRQKSPALFSLILPPAQGPDIFSPTHPEEGKWYNDPNPIFKWSALDRSQGFSYLLDKDPNTSPDTVVDSLDAEATFSDVESGVNYFHVREYAGGSWGGVSHYAVNFDTISPASFGVKVSPALRTSNRNPILRFFTTDSLSGFDHFEVKLVPLKSGPGESSFFFEASSPYQLSDLKPGRYEVVVRAYDKAHNFRDESVTLNIVSSVFQFINSEGIDFVIFFAYWSVALPILLVLVLIVFGFVVAIWLRHRRHVRGISKIEMQKLRARVSRKK